MEDCLSSVMLPSMKLRQKRLCTEREKARHRPVFEDSSNIGVRLLAKQGWSEGKGLGKHENGITVPLAQRYKRDTEGVGFVGGPDDQWTQHDAGFNELLKRLNGEADVASEECSTEFDPKAQLQSLEERSKTSRVRVHYKKFTRGKDLSQANDKDLANIFGKRSLAEINKPVVTAAENDSSGNDSDECSEPERPVLGLSTINSSLSIEEYFKEKMKQKMFAIAGGNANGTNGTNDTKSVDQLAVEEEHSAVDDVKPEKKKNKKKHKDEEESLPPPVEETGASETVSSKKQKRKRENIEPIEEILAVEEITEVLVEPESELSQMIKKKKKSKKALPEPESTVGETNEVAQEEHVEDAAISEEPAKKKKKSRKSKIDDSMETDGTQTPVTTHKTFEDTNETTTNEVAQEEHVEDVDAIAEEPTRKKKKSKKCKIDESMESDINETPVTHKSIEETNEITTNEVAKEAHVEDVAAIAEEPAKKKRKSKKGKIEETVPLETSEPAMKIKTSKNNKDKVDAESKSNGKDNMNTIEETQTPTTLQQNLPPSAELPPMEDEEELTCKVKVHVLKYLDESRFNGSNFGDIIGYRLTEQVRLIKNEARASRWKKRN